MKKLKNILLLMMIAAVFSGCGPTAEDILKQYDTYGEIKLDENKAGVSIQVGPIGNFTIKYSSTLLNANAEHIQKLSERWFVADAENPDVKLPINIGIVTENGSSTKYKTDGSVESATNYVAYGHFIKTDSIQAKFLLIGFEGISSTESKEIETQPLFYLVENNKVNSKMLNTTPKLTGQLFSVNYEPMFFTEQEYSGEIQFEKSKKTTLYLTVSADLKKVTKLTLSTEELYLTPANFSKQNKSSSKQDIVFKYMEKSRVAVSFAIKQTSGYNVPTDDVSNMQFTGGFETTSPIEVIDGKITLDFRPLICDLTVTNSCIYGTVNVEIEGCGTKSVYAVFKNTTTPQEIPENILKQNN